MATMEMDTQTAAVPLMHSPENNNAGRILSMEEFMASRAQGAAAEEGQAAGGAPQPRAVSARSSKYTVLLNEKYQAFGIPRPHFVFSGSSEEGWGATTQFLEQELVVDCGCGSKQEAKERLSEKALGVILELEKEGTLRLAPRTKKEKKSEGGVEGKVEQVDKEPDVNYIGQLMEFQLATASPQPVYADYQLDQSFSCELTIDGLDQPFGGRTTYFPSKKGARKNAARCAVEHFQAQKLWPDTFTDLGGIKKKKNKKNTVAQPQQLASHPDDPDPPTSPSSYAQRAATLATQLSLGTPEWRFSSPVPAMAPGFHTVSCYFKNGGSHEGPIGEVRHVFGKKKAKEECARLTLQYLVGVREKRVEYGRRMMGGVVGGEAVVHAGVDVGLFTEGGGEVEAGESSEGEGVAFVDAVERV